MKFNFSNVQSSKVEIKKGAACVVSKATLAQMEKVGGDSGLRQAVIILRRIGDIPQDGLLNVKVDGQVYKLARSGKEINLRVTSQTEATIEAYGELFNKLASTPDKEYDISITKAE